MHTNIANAKINSRKFALNSFLCYDSNLTLKMESVFRKLTHSLIYITYLQLNF